MKTDKKIVHDFWNEASCGELLLMHGETMKARFAHQLASRYEWEPEILSFTQFEKYAGKKVLEIGVGLGADHQKWAEVGVDLYGIDLTERAIKMTGERFECLGLKSNLRVADAEDLPYDDNSFDVVYSWGVLLYCPNLYKGISEVRRVLKPGGTAIVMLYHTYSFVGYMLWLRYALLCLRPFRSLRDIYFHHLESEGTQAFSVAEAESFFSEFSEKEIDINLTHGDLLTSGAGQKHKGIFLDIARKIWPRWLIKTFFPKHGLFMKIRAIK